MNKQILVFLSLLIFSLQAKSPLRAIKEREEKFELARPKPQEYYEQLMQAYQSQDQEAVLRLSKELIHHYPASPLAAEAHYLMGVTFFDRQDLERSNAAFTNYLKESQNLTHFEQAVEYKFRIANLFESGVKKRLFGLNKMPKLIPAKDEALAIYDEVIAAMPRSELAAQSLFHKAGLLVFFEDYKNSIEMYQTLIRRFPKNGLVPQSFCAIGTIYFKQCQDEYPDPALVELAEINLKKFQSEYPGEPLVYEVKEQLTKIQGIFADELIKIGSYFIKKKKYQSAYIYFKTVISRYPDTRYSDQAKEKIALIKKKGGEIKEDSLLNF